MAVFHTRDNSTALDRSVIGSPGAVRIRPGTVSAAAGCSAGGLVTVEYAANTAFGLAGMPAAANTAAAAAEAVTCDSELASGAR